MNLLTNKQIENKFNLKFFSQNFLQFNEISKDLKTKKIIKPNIQKIDFLY